MVCPLDASGRFTDKVTDFKGMYVKDADKEIIKYLKDKGRMVSASTVLDNHFHLSKNEFLTCGVQVKHSYPFCWRSQTPLLQRAVPSWFMKVQQMRERLLSHNEETYWVSFIPVLAQSPVKKEHPCIQKLKLVTSYICMYPF